MPLFIYLQTNRFMSFITRNFFLFLLLILCLSCFPGKAQNGLTGIGQWRMHLPYNKAVSVAEGNGKIYCASRYGLFSYDKEDGSIERYSRISGLSDLEISSIRYSNNAHVLVIAYENSNIDLFYDDNTIINLSDIKRSSIVGNKSVNDIFFRDHFAYLSCGFGIVVLDLSRKEIKDTYFIGPNGAPINVNGLTTDNTWFYAATDNGIYKAQVNNPFIFNFSEWSKDTTILNRNGKYTSIAYFSGRIFTVETDVTGFHDYIRMHDTAWSSPPIDSGDVDMKISTYLNHLNVKLSYTIEAYDASLTRTHVMSATEYPNTLPKDGFIANDNTFWIADFNNGLIRIKNFWDYSNLTPNGPKSPSVYAMQVLNDDLWVASGTIKGTTPAYSYNGTYLFTDEEWKTFDRTNDSIYNRITFTDVNCMAIDPSDSKHAFVGSWGSGLLEYRDHGAVHLYDESNSPIHAINGASPGYYLMAIGGAAFDNNKNLWVANCATNLPLLQLSSTGTWTSHPLPSQFSVNYFYQLLVDDFNQKWIIGRGGANGIGVFNENDLANPNDNSFQLLTASAGSGNLPSTTVFSMAKDKDGAIWMGTDKGVAVIYNPGSVFTGDDYDAQRILLQQDGHTQYLLETESVLAVAVDGANRKWFGTVSGGVFLMSEDGTQQLKHFDADNSPLLSNYITSIAINDNTGEVFFGTEKGIVSYRSDATVGGETCDKYLVFPNPVTHDYSGPIAVKGLVNNADVRITDLSGSLVYHTKANGGEAIWYGNNFKGERAHTGVYLVYVSNEDGSATCVTKMLFVH